MWMCYVRRRWNQEQEKTRRLCFLASLPFTSPREGGPLSAVAVLFVLPALCRARLQSPT